MLAVVKLALRAEAMVEMLVEAPSGLQIEVDGVQHLGGYCGPREQHLGSAEVPR